MLFLFIILMRSGNFLRQVAAYYFRQSGGDPAGLTFVTPNRRSALFLKRYFQELVSADAAFMPRFVALPAWVARQAPRTVPDRWEALFLLYGAYRRVLARHGQEDRATDFDRFIFWGDIIISDFDDIDRSLCDASAIYTNLRRLRSIRADYLTDEQKEIIRLLWGDTPMTGDIDRFWFHTSPGDEGDGMAARFVSLWQILGDLYAEYRSTLDAAGYATAGMQSRLAAEAVAARQLDEIAAGPRYVFVGLSEIYPAEKKILDRYALAGAADFVWDTEACEIYAGESAPRGVGTVARLARHYPAPDGFVQPAPPAERMIDIVGVPSSIAQAKQAADTIAGLAAQGSLDPDNAINTAVVLPDPAMLTPLMLALPERLRSLNITMAVPYSQTTFATLLRAVVSMQSRLRRRRGEWTFFYADVLDILAHPHIRLIAPDEAERLRTRIRRDSLYNIASAEIAAVAPSLSFIFEPAADPDSTEAVYGYLRGLLRGLDAALRARVSQQAAATSPELMTLESLTRRLESMREMMHRYDIEPGQTTIFSIFERLLASDVLTLTGTPLMGLQIMGTLETRALDFDNIIFLSLNERVFPRRDTVKTMIPNALRVGYGLPPIDREEAAMNYYFYRAISRATYTQLLYDSRPAARGGGEISRYISQIMYGPLSHTPGVKVSHRTVDMSGVRPGRRVVSVAKSGRVISELDRYRLADGGRNISASALKEYMRCPLGFYLKYVKGYRAEDELTDYLGAADMGNIFHKTMELLYGPYAGRTVTAADISAMLSGDVIRSQMLQAYYDARPGRRGTPYEKLDAEAMLVLSQIEVQIRMMLEAERELYPPFVFVAAEKGEAETVAQWQVTPGLKVNFRMNIDRIDRSPDGSRLRFVDYKTGSDSLSAGDRMDNLFDGDHRRQAIFQLMLYREAYRDIHGFDGDIELRLHVMKDIVKQGKIADLTYCRKPLCSQPEAAEDFRARLNVMLTEIFDDTTPFVQAEDIEACKYCQFRGLCNRQTSD